MNKKVLRYIILLLIIPIIISIIFSITSAEEASKTSNKGYDGLSTPNYPDTKIDEIKRSNTYIYVSVFSLLIIAGGVWIYVKKKGEF